MPTITPVLAATATPMATRNRVAAPRCGKASGLITDLRMYNISTVGNEIIFMPFRLPIY